MLETTECIGIKNNGRNYTDCMEFSLLRFLHLIFYSESQLFLNKFSTYELDSNPNLKINSDLIKFIESNPKIYSNSTYYLNDKGVDERESWAKIVSDRDYFQYYRTDGAELFTNIKNILIFCYQMLGLELNLDYDDSNNLEILSKKISSEHKNISIKIFTQEKNVSKTHINNILNIISKEQDDMTNLPKKIYDVVTEKTVIDLQVNGYKYEWNLYGVYFLNETLVTNKFITGHSVITNKF
jgi:hypothetical protein